MADAMIRLVKLRRTCNAFPSQLEAECVDGGYFYARFRHGVLSWGTGLTMTQAVEDSDNHEMEVEGGGGEMTTEEMLARIGAVVLDAHPVPGDTHT